MDKKPFTFAISLSVLDHLGRNLYRSFATVLGEAISNSWDADAKNVWIYLDKDNDCLVIKDDGDGMTYDDFQHKFLKIGYSKRRKNKDASKDGRPFIGRKGIGKLALLSCAKKISVISKTENSDYVGGVVDNAGLDDAITEDVEASEYHLGSVEMDNFNKHTWKHKKGTIIYFESIRDGIKNSIEFLRKIVALYFRFSLIDPSFKIFLDDEEITLNDLQDLMKSTEFLWTINGFRDSYIDMIKDLKEKGNIPLPANPQIVIWGFIASVKKPKDAKIFGSGEKIGIDLFVNGRLREKDIQKYVPTARIVENYLYGQIHFDGLDDKEKDRFSTSREGIVANDEKFKEFLKVFREEIISKILDKWDEWRLAHKEDGDPDNPKMPKYKRKAEESKNWREKDFRKKIDDTIEDEETRKKLKDKLKELSEKNTILYQDLFILENLFREYIKNKDIKEEDFDLLNKDEKEVIDLIKNIRGLRKDAEKLHPLKGKIVKEEHYLNYADLFDLSEIVDIKIKNKGTKKKFHGKMVKNTNDVGPIRNPVMHTNEITIDALEWDKIEKLIDYMDKLK